MKRTLVMPYVLNKVQEKNIEKYGKLTCELCHKRIKTTFEYDHIIPVSKFERNLAKGRMNGIRNLQIAHRICNRLKSNLV
jgi:5-methylcytosine-specific restriction endonuclease McrA